MIALTYGTQADWVRNVLAAGGCELVTRGQRYALADPEIVHDETREAATWFARPILRLVGAADFMRLRYRGERACDVTQVAGGVVEQLGDLAGAEQLDPDRGWPPRGAGASRACG